LAGCNIGNNLKFFRQMMRTWTLGLSRVTGKQIYKTISPFNLIAAASPLPIKPLPIVIALIVLPFPPGSLYVSLFTGDILTEPANDAPIQVWSVIVIKEIVHVCSPFLPVLNNHTGCK
jgi:hypothetical protein